MIFYIFINFEMTNKYSLIVILYIIDKACKIFKSNHFLVKIPIINSSRTKFKLYIFVVFELDDKISVYM